MTKTLTEQWRDGTLERGYYYYKTKVGVKVIGYQCFGLKFPYDYYHNTIDSVEEVLADVPSYEEYRELLDLNVYEKDRKKVMGLEDKIKRLQERLTIATKALKEYADSSNWYETDDFGISAVDQFACDDYGYNIAKKALEEMKGVK